MRRLLVVSYYTPPLGMSGVMRVTKLCKFLPEFGWKPLVLTVKPVAYYALDPDLGADLRSSAVYRTESVDPNRLLYLLRWKRARLAPALHESAGRAARLFGLVAFPDAKLGWFPFGSVAGRHIIDREKPAAILATGPPFTALLLGVRLKAHGHVPLVVDFRDQWPTGFAAPPRWQRAPLRHVRRYVLRHADLALAVNAGTARAVGPGVQVLDNGFDPTDFEVPAERLGGLSVVHVGNAWRNEQTMLAFADALRGVPEARLYLAGAVGAELQRRLAGHPQVRLLGPLPHRRCMALLKGADALLYVGKPGQPAGIKLYEYIGARRPVLVWGSGAGEAVDMVVGLRAGCHCGEDGGRLSSVLATLRSPGFRFAPVDTGRFDRRAQARWLAGQLERLVVGPG